ncbi:MAG: hypothetical protein ACYC1P_13740 [Gaiellaceae bacterium]
MSDLDPRDPREVAEMEAWFRRRGMRVEVDKTADEWFVTVTDAAGTPVLVTGRGSTKLEALNDAQAFLD